MVSQSMSRKRGLPLWANLLMAFVVTVIVSVSFSAFRFFMTIREMAIDAGKPETIAACAKRVADFPEPLPDGCKYLWACDLGYLTLVVIEHGADKQQIALWCFQGELPPSVDSKSVLNNYYDLGMNTFYTVSKFHELKGHGTETIAGASMPYLVGEYVDATGHNAQGMVGLIGVNKAAKNILIYSYPDPPNAYNQQVTLDLLRAIKGF
jgi:hypothetical protein